MRKGRVSVGIVMVVAGIAHSVQAQQHYVFPELETGRYSNEFYAGFSHSSYLNPSFRVYQDVRLTVPGPVKRLWLAPFINYSRSLDRAVLENRTYGGLSVAIR